MNTSQNAPIRVGRISPAEHAEGRWRIIDIAADFALEDLWALPASGSLADFPRVLEMMHDLDIATDGSLPTRVLWQVRDLLGKWFGLGRITEGPEPATLPIPGSTSTTLADRLPSDLVGTLDPRMVPGDAPFTALYRTDREYAAEMSNATVHSIMHLGWAHVGGGTYQAQMAVYVKPRGVLGRGYMALIKPFRYAFVYPDLMRVVERAWRRSGDRLEPQAAEPAEAQEPVAVPTATGS
jgi:uncharacterized protein DUF2867